MEKHATCAGTDVLNPTARVAFLWVEATGISRSSLLHERIRLAGGEQCSPKPRPLPALSAGPIPATATPNKKPPCGWHFIWWRRRESNPTVKLAVMRVTAIFLVFWDEIGKPRIIQCPFAARSRRSISSLAVARLTHRSSTEWPNRRHRHRCCSICRATSVRFPWGDEDCKAVRTT
jgi:hypothetical protein